MYRVDRTRSRKKLFIQFLTAFILFFAAIVFAVWFFIIREDRTNSANFSTTGDTIAIVKASYEEFTTDEFSIELPQGWVLLGKRGTAQTDLYYEFQSKIENYENRWLKVYIDAMPPKNPINQLLPITPDGNRLIVGKISGDCRSFDGAPKQGSALADSQTWEATWQDITFTCNTANVQNHTGTASLKDGIAVPVTGSKGTHTYFFVYTDHNIRPQISIMTDAVKSFEAL
jgi:hypothetical protein